LYPADPFFSQKVRELAAQGDPARRVAVGADLTRLANELVDKSWLEAARPRVVAANTAAGLRPTEEQLQAQLEEWRTELLTRTLDAMQFVGAPGHVAFGFAVAEDKSAPLSRRKAALRLLDSIVAAGDLPAVTKREAVRSELANRERAAQASPSNDVASVVARMREPFRLCFQKELARAAGPYRGVATFTIQPSGDVSTVAVSDLPPPMADCIGAVVRTSRFAPAAEAQVVKVPLTFVPQSQNADSAVSPCLPYEPAPVELTGVLERRDYAGPPNYESIEHGDKKETTWLLRLDRQACTEESPDSAHAARIGLQLMQLVFDPATHPYDKYRPLMGKHIVARGSLFTAQTGHHHTEVLITVSELEATN
jgi:hypothetical protein